MHYLKSLILILATGILITNASAQSEILSIDYGKLISRADLVFDEPPSRSEAGLPVGNGTMGSLVWTSPSQLKFQINRVDVYANNRNSYSFFERSSDYGFGTGFVDIDFVDYGPDVFTQSDTRQHLSVYDALLDLNGKGIETRALAWNAEDVMAVEITDKREQPQPISTVLRMLRPPQVRTRNHTAISKLEEREGMIILTQEFREDDYYCGSALVIKVLGRDTRSRNMNEQEMRLTTAPGNGTFTVLMSGAASFDRKEDITQLAINQVKKAAAKGFGGLLESNRNWWKTFWEKSFIHLQSEDGVADMIERNYTYYLYVMASSSRGKYPPRFGGMIWKTGGDVCAWGTKHWFHNLSCYYRTPLEANRMELMEPMFDMYWGMYETCETAARQTWGSKGIWIPEAVGFDGLAELPDDIASEMQDLYLLRKPWELRSQRFRDFADTKHPHDSPWNWKGSGHWEKGKWVYESLHGNPFGYLVHILTTTAKISWLFWLQYEYTMDEIWLRERAYPMVKGCAEFFRNFPGLRKGSDGKYHIHNLNNHELVRGCQDPLESIAAMRGILPLAIKGSEMLEVDAGLREGWKYLLDNLAPIPTNDDVNSMTPRKPGEPKTFTAGSIPFEGGSTHWSRFIALAFYDLCTLENPDDELRETANASFDRAYPEGIRYVTLHAFRRTGIAAAALRRPDDIKYLIPNQTKLNEFNGTSLTGTGVLPNRMTLNEGRQAIGVEHLGRAGASLQYALLQSVPPVPGKNPVINVFPAWPKEWSAEYTLAARGGFLVTSSVKNGKIDFVELVSLAGRECSIRNPWEGSDVVLYRNGKNNRTISGSLLRFDTVKGEQIVLVPPGVSPDQLIRTIL